MKANFSINDIIHIQVVSRLSDLLFDELQKIDVQGAPLSIWRIHLKAIENAAAIQRTMIDLLRGIPGEGTAFARRQLKKLTESAQCLPAAKEYLSRACQTKTEGDHGR